MRVLLYLLMGSISYLLLELWHDTIVALMNPIRYQWRVPPPSGAVLTICLPPCQHPPGLQTCLLQCGTAGRQPLRGSHAHSHRKQGRTVPTDINNTNTLMVLTVLRQITNVNIQCTFCPVVITKCTSTKQEHNTWGRAEWLKRILGLIHQYLLQKFF